MASAGCCSREVLQLLSWCCTSGLHCLGGDPLARAAVCCGISWVCLPDSRLLAAVQQIFKHRPAAAPVPFLLLCQAWL